MAGNLEKGDADWEPRDGRSGLREWLEFAPKVKQMHQEQSGLVESIDPRSRSSNNICVQQRRRDRAVSIVNSFKESLVGTHGEEELRRAVESVRSQLLEVQSGRSDRPHFAKSLCRVATAVRRRGFPRVAADLLDWALENEIVDPYVLSEAVVSHLLSGHECAADAVLGKARSFRMVAPGLYATLIAACARTANVPRAQSLFQQARQDEVADGTVYTALIAVYGRMDLLTSASALLSQSKAEGRINGPSYTALISAYIRRDDLSSAEGLYAEARFCGLADERTYTSMLNGYGRKGDLVSAARVFEQAEASGHADLLTVVALLFAYAKAGDSKSVSRLVKIARARGVSNACLREARQEAYRRRCGRKPRQTEKPSEPA